MTPALLRYVIVALGLGLLPSPVEAFSQERDCPVPERFYASDPPLTKTAKALAGGREVVIAVLGGSSTLGLAAGVPSLAWPARLASILTGRFPSARIKVVNLAVARQTAKATVERLRRDVLPLKPTLVIWETGTMEAVCATDVDDFRETLQAGIDELRASGAEVVLMNMQFSRETDAMISFGPYLIAIRELANANDVPLFRRHGIMRYWAESDFLDLRAREAEKRRQVAAKLYDCIGLAMADFVTRGVAAAKATAGPGGDR
jgi:lysophospholipase L1-like esterase